MPREKSNVVVPFSFVLLKSLYVSFTFFFLQVTMSQDRVVTCFHEYVMKKKKKYEVLVLYIIAIVKIVAKCSIMVTNPNCGKHSQISAIGNI